MNTATDTPAPALSVTPPVADVYVDTGELRLSGPIAGPRTTHRGVIAALHGGTYDSAYYDSGPGSLLQLGALLGYPVIALDRPGYGATCCRPSRRRSPHRSASRWLSTTTSGLASVPVSAVLPVGFLSGMQPLTWTCGISAGRRVRARNDSPEGTRRVRHD